MAWTDADLPMIPYHDPQMVAIRRKAKAFRHGQAGPRTRVDEKLHQPFCRVMCFRKDPKREVLVIESGKVHATVLIPYTVTERWGKAHNNPRMYHCQRVRLARLRNPIRASRFSGLK